MNMFVFSKVTTSVIEYCDMKLASVRVTNSRSDTAARQNAANDQVRDAEAM